MKKIGILLIESLPLPPVKGGAVENLVQLIVDNNEEHHGLYLYIFSKYDSKAEEESQSFKNTSYKYYRPIGIWKIIDFILKVVRRLFRNYLHINTPSLYEIQAYLYFKKQGIKTLVLENCPTYAIYQNRKNEFHLILHLHNDYLNEPSKQNDKIFSHTQQILAVSNFIKSRLDPIVPNCIPVDVCYNGIDLQRFSNPISEERKSLLMKKHSISASDRIITFTGRLVSNKGVKELMLAFEKITSRLEDVKLLIIGGQSFSNNEKDSYGAELETIAKRLSNKVVFTGYVDYKDVADYLKISTLVVAPSTSYESFSLSTLEALACGVPVIVSDAGGMLEVIDEKSGVVVKRGVRFVEELSIAIERLLCNKETLLCMSVAAVERAKIFTDKKMYNRFSELIK